MAAQVSIQTVDALGAEIYVSFNVALSGSYVTGGEPLNFTGSGTLPVTQDASYVGLVAAVESSNLLQVDCWSQGGNLSFQYVPIVTKAGSPSIISPQTGVKLKVSASASFGTEHAASAYEAGITGDSVTGFAIFTKMI
jgi:hypothetical protein